jgi:hypothetical protein
MATLTKGKTFVNGELVTPANLHQMVDAATVANIVNADIAANAAIADTKLATISTANKVSQSAVTNLTTDLAGKAASIHQHAIADTTGLQTALDGKAAASHNHDDRYYTESEINTLLAGKQASGSYAPASGIAPSAITGTAVITTDSRLSDARTPTTHNHDDRYYTETEIDTKLSGLPVSGHNHDDRYYTESEMNTLLAGKQASGSYAPATGIAPSAISGRFNNFIFGFLNEAGFGGFETTSAIGTTIVSDAGRNSVPEAILARWQRTNGSGVTSTIGTITTTGSGASTTGVAYNTTSDYRLKTNIEPLTDALARLLQIPAHRFNWLADPNGQKVDGFLAHEAQAVVPESVTGTKDAVDADGKPIYQGIDQSKLVPLLVAAVQELAARVAALEAK